MDAEKLLRLANGLENYVRDEWWNYGKFFSLGFPTHTCGSVACAVGWSVPIMDDPRLQFKEHTYPAGYYITLDGNRLHPYELMMAKYFDIPYDDAESIFNDPDSYGKLYAEVTRNDVAAKIRKYVTDNRESNPCYAD